MRLVHVYLFIKRKKKKKNYFTTNIEHFSSNKQKDTTKP